MHLLITPRLTLRPPLPPDAEAISALIGNFAVSRMLTSPPWPYTEAHAADWIERCGAKPDDLVFTIHRERLIGVVSVEHRDEGAEPELGYWLGEPWWGQGFMTEAAAALLDHAFASLPALQAIGSGAFADNMAALRIQEKLGFAQIGTKDLYSNARGAVGPSIRTRLLREHFERFCNPPRSWLHTDGFGRQSISNHSGR
jgi:RimJ/RimL family protein N-acetyltransferase